MELRVPAGAPARFHRQSHFHIAKSQLDRRPDPGSHRGLNPQSLRIKSSRLQLIIRKYLLIPTISGGRAYRFFASGWERQGVVPLQARAAAEEEEEGCSTRIDGRSEERHLKIPGGTVFGAASLIIGTSVGSGILALPQKTSPAGFVPSAVSIVACWAFLVVEALLVAEINVALVRTKKDEGEEAVEVEELPVVSFKTMAQETLGDLGGAMVTITYVFLGYTSMTAYTAESGELLSHLLSLPPPVLGVAFTLALAALVCFGGTRNTDVVNQWLTTFMIGLLVAMEITMASMGNWAELTATEDWMKVPRAIPVIVFALVYHDIAPLICSYLGGDMRRIRWSILIGSIIPLVSLLVWDGVVLSYPSPVDGSDPLELLLRGGDPVESTMAETFSILAVATSLIGTLLGFSSFFHEQFYLLFRNRAQEQQGEGVMLNLSTVAVAVIPPLLISVSLADAFSVATDIAGGYCMMVLYGVLPPAMAWSLRTRQSGGEEVQEEEKKGYMSEAKPVLVGAGLFATVLVAGQLFQDVPFLLHL